MISPGDLDLSSLPWMPLSAKAGLIDEPGIYFAIDSLDVVQYVGRSRGVRGRWKNHHRFSQLSRLGGVRICYMAVDDESLLPAIEEALIHWFSPPLNVAGIEIAGKPDRRPSNLGPKVSAYVPEDLKEKAEQLAADEGRSLSNYIEQLLKNQVLAAEAAGRKWAGDSEGKAK